MKLTWCSFVDFDCPIGGGRFKNTVVILEGEHEQIAACNICLERKIIGSNGEFIALPVPTDREAEYAPHVGRPIDGEEARALFDGRSFDEWDEHFDGMNSWGSAVRS